ncbi:MAG: hypothetical protein ACTHZ9_03400 [Leucobacter sp.]
MQQLGGAIGTAGMITALTIGGAGASSASNAILAGTTAAFILGATLSLIAVIVALTVRGDRLRG